MSGGPDFPGGDSFAASALRRLMDHAVPKGAYDSEEIAVDCDLVSGTLEAVRDCLRRESAEVVRLMDTVDAQRAYVDRLRTALHNHSVGGPTLHWCRICARDIAREGHAGDCLLSPGLVLR